VSSPTLIGEPPSPPSSIFSATIQIKLPLYSLRNLKTELKTPWMCIVSSWHHPLTPLNSSHTITTLLCGVY